MGARYIECSVNNEFVSGAGQVIGAAGSHHDVYLRLTFGEMWDGLSMYVTFRDALGENPTVVQILPTNLVLGTERTYDVVVPAAPKAKQGKAMVTVQGYTVVGGTQEATATNTATAYFTVLPSDYALADDESIDATIAQQLQAEIDEIGETVTDARLAAKDAEAWAVGQIEGADVPETDERYQNNSKYYAQRADESATEAYGYARSAFGSASSASGSATAAAGSAATATDSAEDSEAWAVGQRGGTDVPSSDETYHNNAKYWAGQAQQAAGGGVSSFNGRSGAVVPQSGDYTAAMVGARASDWTPTASDVGADQSGAAAAVQASLNAHASNNTIHISAEERTSWNAKANFPDGGTEGQILTKTATGAEWDDAPLGFAPQVVVTAPTGSTVTLTSGTTTLTATESGGTWTFDVPSYGTWTATATLSGQTATGSVSVTEVKQYTISLAYIPEDVDKATWAQISEVSQAGTGDTYWDVGDCKAITLNGKIGDFLTLSNKTVYVFILAFNHNSANGETQGILWGGFKTAKANGTLFALFDSKYSPDASWASYTDGSKTFTMNHKGNSNKGGWKGCDFRYDILGATETQPANYNGTKADNNAGYDATAAARTSPVANTLAAALPSDMCAVLKLRTHYVDNVGNSSNVAANVTAVVDLISLMCEFEIFGSRSYANQYEQNKQAQFAYFAAGNAHRWFKENATTTGLYVWEASPDYNNATYFCYVSGDGSAYSNYAYYSLALAAAFLT